MAHDVSVGRGESGSADWDVESGIEVDRREQVEEELGDRVRRLEEKMKEISWRGRSNAIAAGESGGAKVRVGDAMRGVMASGENGSSGTEFGGSG